MQRAYCFFNNGVTLHDVPLAETEEQQEKGLSGEDVHFRKMLFRFDPPARVSFWMKDTKVPLSIAFISSEGIIFQMEDMTPDTLNYHTPTQPVAMALEVQQGEFERMELGRGLKLVRLSCAPLN